MMKNLKYTLVLISIITLALGFNSCANSSQSEKDEKTEEHGKEYTSAFICPMNCKGSGSTKPGKCPVCKMDYIANKKVQNENDHSDHNHDGHDH